MTDASAVQRPDGRTTSPPAAGIQGAGWVASYSPTKYRQGQLGRHKAVERPQIKALLLLAGWPQGLLSLGLFSLLDPLLSYVKAPRRELRRKDRVLPLLPWVRRNGS